MAYPIMPDTTTELWNRLGLAETPIESMRLPDDIKWGSYPAGKKLEKGESLFPRLEE